MKNKYSKTINATRRQSVLEYISNNYSLESLVRELGIWNGGSTVIKCPFHPDSRPSFNIDLENNFYKCFSCGSSGGYATLYHEYHKTVTEDGKFFNDHVEELLQADEKMQETLGFSTIFIKFETQLSLEELSKFKYQRHDFIRVDTKSLQLIQRKLQKDHEMLVDFFADIEKGMLLNDLWNKYYLGLKPDDVLLDTESKSQIELAFSALLSDDNDEEDRDDSMEITNLF